MQLYIIYTHTYSNIYKLYMVVLEALRQDTFRKMGKSIVTLNAIHSGKWVNLL